MLPAAGSAFDVAGGRDGTLWFRQNAQKPSEPPRLWKVDLKHRGADVIAGRTALGGDYRASAHCSRACSVTARLERPGRGPRVATGRARLTQAGEATVSLRFTPRGRRVLAHARRVGLVLVMRVRSGHRSRTTRSGLTLRSLRPQVRCLAPTNPAVPDPCRVR